MPDLYVAILADTLHDKHIEPVPRQFSAVLLNHPAFAQQSIYRIDVDELHILGGAVQVGKEGEIVLGQAGGRNRLHNRSPHRRG